MPLLTPSRNQRSGLLIGFLCSLLCVVYQSLYRAVPSNIDLYTGLPIGKEFAFPGLFSPYDLVISSGLRGPFYLYQYLGGFLYGIHANVDVVWECFFVFFLFLSFLAFWFLSIELTGDLLSSALVIAFIAVAHPLRGSLHAAAVPQQSFVTTLAAMPLALAALIFLLRKRYFLAMALSGLVFDLHSYVGVLTGIAIASVIFLRSEKPLGTRIAIIACGGALGLPNAIYIVGHLPSIFSSVGFDFYSQLRQYALHVFVEDYWREGYGWFFMNLAGAVWFARYIEPWKRRTVWTLFMCWFTLMVIYVFNSYVTKNTAILLLFLMRATYFIKPIIFIFVVHGIRRWHSELRKRSQSPAWWSPWELSAAGFLLFFSSILPMKYSVAADALAFLAYGFMVRVVPVRSTFVRSLFSLVLPVAGGLLFGLTVVQFPTMLAYRDLTENIIVGLVVLYALILLAVFKYDSAFFEARLEVKAGDSTLPAIVFSVLTVLVVHNLIISINDRRLPFIPDVEEIKQRIFIHQAPPATAALMLWARTTTPRKSLFAVCPDDWNNFCGFRLVADRGLYITIEEINQLSLDPAVYEQGQHRVQALGTKFPRRGEFDTRGYYDLSLSDLKRLRDDEHVDFMIFEKSLLHGDLSGVPPAYSDDRFIVVNLHDLVLR